MPRFEEFVVVLVLFTLHVHVLFGMVTLVEAPRRRSRLLFLYERCKKCFFLLFVFYREYLCTETILSACFQGMTKFFRKETKKDV